MDAVAQSVGQTDRASRWSDDILAKLYHRILDRIDAGLTTGTMTITTPDGSVRRLGKHSHGLSCTITIYDWRALSRLAWSGSVGLYEGWAAGEWHSADPVPFFEIVMRNRQTLGSVGRAKGWQRIAKLIGHLRKENDRAGARRNIIAHYDLGNDFYAAWLDPTMSYSSALFAAGDDLEAAQRRKQAAILDRLALKPGMTMLEIGCGWGSLAQAAHDRSAKVTAISLSPSQLAYACAHHASAICFEETDYRDVTGVYDAIASVEMVEAVGEQYWPAYLDTISHRLKPGGRAAIQYISIADDAFDAYRENADFIQTYVFPGGMLLSESRFRALAEARGLAWTDQRDMGVDYAETLKCWRERFDSATLPPQFDGQFRDLWLFYLMYCEGGFRGGGINVAQVTLVKRG
jgi:cyclopropane-fatty-acyl-phospholipid synthase